MKFNQFIWNNYKESKRGGETIRFWEEESWEKVFERFLDEKNKSIDWYNTILFELEHSIIKIEKKESIAVTAKNLFNCFFEKGLVAEDEEGQFSLIEEGDSEFLINIIEPYSAFLFDLLPDFFFPYFFQFQFVNLQKLCDCFEIKMPNVPLKKSKKNRLFYYLELCDLFYEFRQNNSLNPYEFCAFLYDFTPNFIGKEESIELPEPNNIWLCGASKGDYAYLLKAGEKTTYFWQGNEDTKKGDIIVIYCLSPRSNIEFICRAVNDGIRDPFFYYYGSITLGDIRQVKPIHISELKNDSYLKQLPIVRKNLQGVNGTQLNNNDYGRILELLKFKGQDTSFLPVLSKVAFQLNVGCKNEREVETQLVEPLLRALAYNEGDWVRQLTVRMGRGERYYPDYCFGVNMQRGYEKAEMLLEAKLAIKNNRELEEAFQQAHSYALRLQASKIILCDKDYLWIYENRNQSFDRTKHIKYNWKELENPDVFNKVKQIVGKESL